jgi:Lar family restriction alleviation protein
VSRSRARKPKQARKPKRRLSAETVLAQPVTLGGEPMLPCPFCGSTEVAVKHNVNFVLAVECKRCKARGPVPAVNRIIHAQDTWNKRAKP